MTNRSPGQGGRPSSGCSGVPSGPSEQSKTGLVLGRKLEGKEYKEQGPEIEKRGVQSRLVVGVKSLVPLSRPRASLSLCADVMAELQRGELEL